MLLKFVLSIFCVLFTFHVSQITCKTHLPFLPTKEGVAVSDLITRSLGLPDSSGLRTPRNTLGILSLLWPQVVGPIENGIIKDENYDDVPKCPLEHQLDAIRVKANNEMHIRQHVRDLLNQGTSAAMIGVHELHALHTDLSLIYGQHPHSIPSHDVVVHHPAAILHPPGQHDVILHPPGQHGVILHSPGHQDVILHPAGQHNVILHPPSQHDVNLHLPSQHDVNLHPPSQHDVILHPPSQHDVNLQPPGHDDVNLHPPGHHDDILHPTVNTEHHDVVAHPPVLRPEGHAPPYDLIVSPSVASHDVTGGHNAAGDPTPHDVKVSPSATHDTTHNVVPHPSINQNGVPTHHDVILPQIPGSFLAPNPVEGRNIGVPQPSMHDLPFNLNGFMVANNMINPNFHGTDSRENDGSSSTEPPVVVENLFDDLMGSKS